MKHGKKFSLILLLAALVIGVFPVSAQAANREYLIRISAGNKGTIPGCGKAPYSVTLPYGSNLPVPDAVPDDDRYYVKGIKESGKDSFMNGYYVTQDQDFIIVYGIKGQEVSYVVHYLDYETGEVLAPYQIFYADPGDKVVSSHIYIEGYERAFRTTKTLVKWDPTDPNPDPNVLFAYYTKLPAETATAAGGGGGGGGGAAGGGAAAGGNAGNANANAGNANAGNANADNNANANANADNANANANADNANANANADNAAAQQQQAQQPAQQSYAQVEDILDLDVPLASFEDLVGSTGSGSSSDTAVEPGGPAVIEENTKPKTVSKGLLIFFVILFFCLVALLYWYLLFYRKKKKYADVEVVTFAEDEEEDDDFDIEEFRRRHRKKDE